MGDESVRVLLEIMGQSTRLDLPLGQVDRVTD